MEGGDKEAERAKINVKVFLEHMKQKFARTLDIICPDRNAPKDFVIDPNVRPLFELIVGGQILKERKVSLLHLDDHNIAQYKDPDVPIVIFFVPPTPRYVHLINKFNGMLKRNGYSKKLYLIYYPKRTMMCKYFMDQEKLLVSFENSTYDFNFDLIPLDSDLLCLEYKPTVQEMFITSEFTGYNLVAESILRLQMTFGKIPAFLIKGDKSKIAFDIFERLQREHGNRIPYEDEDIREIDALIIMDRTVDLLTPFVTQLSYQGLIDEFLDIEINKISIDKSIVIPKTDKGPTAPGEKISFYLTDPIFSSIKDLETTETGNFLKQRISQREAHMGQLGENPNDLGAMEKKIAEIHRKKAEEPYLDLGVHVAKLAKAPAFKDILSLEQNTLLGEGLKEFYDKIMIFILKKEEPIKIYKLLCLYTQVDGGLKLDDYNNIKKEMVETYGFAHIHVFNQLSQAGLLYSKADSKKWKAGFPTSKKEHKLLNMDLRKENPGRKSFPYAEYTPISVKVVEHAFRQSWTNGWVADKLPGYTSVVGDIRSVCASKDQRKVVVLYMVGGITYAEVGCMRQLAKQMNVELLVATTNIINSKRILEPFMPN